MSFLWTCWCYGIALVTIWTGVVAYNFDLNSAIEYKDPTSLKSRRASYFGFSLALWNPGDTGLEKSWIFIGAPRANSDKYPNATEPGTVFKCNIGKMCKEWIMDSKMGPGDGSWLGGSMQIENHTDPSLVVCGPRWLDKREHIQNAWPMKGICYRAMARHFSDEETTVGHPLLPPYKNSQSSIPIKNYIMAEAGFSMHIISTANSDRNVILGCPGLFSGHGTPIQYSIKNNNFNIPNVLRDFSVSEYDYSGYAVTSGYYLNGQYKNTRLYATSAPRSENLIGKVVIFNFPGVTHSNDFTANVIRVITKRVGSQPGEYFGAALASCDIDGDGNDDLIVGAPQWTANVDEGRVYTFRDNIKEAEIFDGKKARGRFGTAIMCLGDIDYDGYADVAVGAPYEDRGVVYIFHGGKNGLTESQTIVGSKNTKGFGISISQPQDLDNNGYADIAIGAYLSGHVTLFRSKRAVTTSVTIKSLMSEKTLPTNATSFLIEICSSYSGKHAPAQLKVIKELKIDEIHQRATIIVDGQNRRRYKFNDTLKLNDTKKCDTFRIYIKKGNVKFLDPMILFVTQRLDTDKESKNWLDGTTSDILSNDKFDSLSVAINAFQPPDESTLDVSFAVMCSNDRICYSHLYVEMQTDLKMSNSYVIGSRKNITMYINVNNTGDEAHNTKAIITIPSILRFKKLPITPCSNPQETSKNIQVTCDIANPLKKNETKSLEFVLDMSRVPSDAKEIKLSVEAKTDSTDATSGHNQTSKVIKCVAKRDIGIIRKNTMDRYLYTLKIKEEQPPSIAFEHIYEIKNYEVTPIDIALLSVSIPTHWIHAGKNVEIVRINKILGYLDGQQKFECTDAEKNKNTSAVNYDATIMTKWLTGNDNSSKLVPELDRKFTIINGKVLAASPENRTLHINCTNPLINCKTIDCKLELKDERSNTQPVAILVLAFDLLLPNLIAEIIEEKDIIFFVTNGSVKISELPHSIPINNEPDSIMLGTLFTGTPLEFRLPQWVIPLSVFIGLLLLILVSLALYKFGFFKRNKQEELRALLQTKDQETPEIAAGSN